MIRLSASIVLLLWFSCLPVSGQYAYGLKPMDRAAYLSTVEANSEKKLINLAEFLPGLSLDIRYATTNNFTGERIYELARAYARKPVAEALREVQKDCLSLSRFASQPRMCAGPHINRSFEW